MELTSNIRSLKQGIRSQVIRSVGQSIAILWVSGVVGLAIPAVGQVVTFENFEEGAAGFSFTDPSTGVTFRDARWGASVEGFTIEYGDMAGASPILPGKYLSRGGIVPGPGISAGAFDFSFSLPYPITHLEFDVICFGNPPGSQPLNLVGYSSTGQAVGTREAYLPGGAEVSVAHAAVSWDVPVVAVSVLDPWLYAFGIDNIAFSKHVEVDVRPGGKENPVNSRSEGVLRVAVLSSPAFDAATVEVATLSLAPGAALALSSPKPQLKDVNGDGNVDVVVFFRNSDLQPTSTTSEVVLTGATSDGAQITGACPVRFRP